MRSFLLCSVILLHLLHLSSSHYGDASYKNDISELSCSDNATCIDNMTKELIRGVKENKTIKVFDMFTIEPINPVGNNDGRSNEGPMARFLNTHAINVDFGRYGVRVVKANSKDSSVAFEIEENQNVNGEGRRRGKKVLRIFLPLLLGFKAASTMIVAIAAVALLTFKAFLASKLALLVTGTMVVKRLMENFSGGFGMQNHPYLYSQYPVDFPTAPGAHPAYTMGNSAYAAPEMYGVTGIGGHAHEMLQQPSPQEQPHDSAGQYSQNFAGIQNPNITSKFGQTAGKRWDAGLKRKPMYYERPSSDPYSSYQEYEN